MSCPSPGPLLCFARGERRRNHVRLDRLVAADRQAARGRHLEHARTDAAEEAGDALVGQDAQHARPRRQALARRG